MGYDKLFFFDWWGKPHITTIRVLGFSFLVAILPAEATSNKPLLEFKGRIYPERFLAVKGEPTGHHAIVWKKGRAAKRALIETDISDQEVADALAGMGVTAANNLSSKTWDTRFDKEAPASDQRVEGTALAVTLEWEGSGGPISLQQILGLPDAVYRFADNRTLISVWRSGCIVCNVSCPGGKIGNRSLTVRDQAEGRLRPKLDSKKLPPEGTEVTVRIERGNPVRPTPGSLP
jgi:hypothetical protein